MNHTSLAETQHMHHLEWVPIFLREVATGPVSRNLLQQRIATNAEVRRWGGTRTYLGAFRFLCAVGFVQESDDGFSITDTGKSRLAQLESRPSVE